MSGGAFDYKQYELNYIADSIEQVIINNGKKRENPDPWESEYYYEYPEDVIQKFEEAVFFIKIAQVYAQRVDWILSGDDGEESFIKRLDEDLSKLKFPEKWEHLKIRK
jgi:hypothetical protein